MILPPNEKNVGWVSTKFVLTIKWWTLLFILIELGSFYPIPYFEHLLSLGEADTPLAFSIMTELSEHSLLWISFFYNQYHIYL
jgi:hypothetical protein